MRFGKNEKPPGTMPTVPISPKIDMTLLQQVNKDFSYYFIMNKLILFNYI